MCKCELPSWTHSPPPPSLWCRVSVSGCGRHLVHSCLLLGLSIGVLARIRHLESPVRMRPRHPRAGKEEVICSVFGHLSLWQSLGRSVVRVPQGVWQGAGGFSSSLVSGGLVHWCRVTQRMRGGTSVCREGGLGRTRRCQTLEGGATG